MNFVVEQNRDAQLRSLLMLETGIAVEKMESVRYYGGFPMSAHHVISGVKSKVGTSGVDRERGQRTDSESTSPEGP